MEIVWCHAASRRLWRAEDLAPISLAGVDAGPYLCLGAGVSLSDDTPLVRLLALASTKTFAWCGQRSSRDVHAFSFSGAAKSDGFFDNLWALLTCLTGTRDTEEDVNAVWPLVAALLARPGSGASHENSRPSEICRT